MKSVLFTVFVWLAFAVIVFAIGFVVYLIVTHGNYNGP